MSDAPLGMGPPATPPPPEDWERKRGFVVKEFISSEETYLKRLQVTFDLYVQPLRKLDVLTSSEVNAQFLNWELLVGLHRDLFENMVRDNEAGTLNLGARFKTFSHFLKCYSQYLTNFERARAERARLLTTNKRFCAFVEKAEASPESQLLPLESYLMEPVQRVPRYRLLLEQLLRYTPDEHPERAAVAEALTLTAEVSQSNSDAIAEREGRQRIMAIMMSLSPATRVNLLDDPSRQLLKEGVLQRQCRRGIKQFKFWLFSDKLLYGDRQANVGVGPTTYSLNRDINLLDCRARSVLDESRGTSSSYPASVGVSTTSNKSSRVSGTTPSDSSSLSMSLDSSLSLDLSSSLKSEHGAEGGGGGGGGGEGGGSEASVAASEPSSSMIGALAKGLGLQSLGLGRQVNSAGSNGNSPARRGSNLGDGAAAAASNNNQDSNAFIVESPQKSFLAWAQSEGEKNAWVDAINSAVDILREKCQREGGSVAPLWTPDAAVSSCQQCSTKFGLVNRRHHCRRCGSNVCAACSRNRCTLASVDASKDVRVCNECFLVVAAEAATAGAAPLPTPPVSDSGVAGSSSTSSSSSEAQKSTEVSTNVSKWTPDHVAAACLICVKPFSLTLRRHHCRNCGVVCCAACSPHRVVLPHVDSATLLRVCSRCYKG